MASTSEALAASLASERARVAELQVLVQQEQKKADKLKSMQATLEDNMSKLYDAAKAKIDAVSQELAAARLEEVQQRGGKHRAPAAAGPPSKRMAHEVNL